MIKRFPKNRPLVTGIVTSTGGTVGVTEWQNGRMADGRWQKAIAGSSITVATLHYSEVSSLIKEPMGENEL